MQADHLISQCIWDSAFDDQENARPLQDALSVWSNTVLQEELNQFFNHLCPAGQIWRIDTLQLDLGKIDYHDLNTELPKRLRASLQEAFGRLITHQQIDQQIKQTPANQSNWSEPAGLQHLQIIEANQSQQEFIRWFLLHGTPPWWFKGAQPALQIMDEALTQQAQASTGLIRDVGRSELVRLRLVRQLGEARVRRIIHLLEPWNSRFICRYADNLFVVQKQEQHPTANGTEFKQHTWLGILTHLLVDRGTLFNTMAFVRANLRHSALHYHISYHSLLEQLHQALQKLEPLGVLTDTFLVAIKKIYQQDHAIHAVAPQVAVQIDYWQPMQAMLHSSAHSRSIGQETIQIDALFAALAQQAPKRMAALLRQEGQSSSVRQGILRHFDAAQLALVVQVLAPHEHEFILAHVRHTQQQMRQMRQMQPVPSVNSQGAQNNLVWQVVLSYLLSHGSVFNRHQLVQNTIRQICRLHGMALVVLLDLLLDSALALHPGPATFALLQILQAFKATLGQQPLPADRPESYRAALRAGLQTGKTQYGSTGLPPLATLMHQLLHNPLLNSPPHGPPHNSPLADLLSAAPLQTVSDAQLSWRLNKLIGPADLPLLFHAIQAQASPFCLALMQHLAQWQQGGYLPALDTIDITYQLPALLLQALLGSSQIRHGQQRAFDPAAFWQDFCTLLQRQTGVDSLAFAHQLRHCPGFASSLPQLARVITTPDRTQFFHLATLESAPHWPYLLHNNGKAFTAWLRRQPNWQQLLLRLLKQRHLPIIGRWLMAQLPAPFKSPQAILQAWASLLRLGRCWQGSTSVLERQLHQIFWLVCFDAGQRNADTGQILQSMAKTACLRLNIRWQDWQTCLQDHGYLLPNSIWAQACKALPLSAKAAARTPASSTRVVLAAGFHQDYAGHYLQHPHLVEITRHLLRKGQPPRWLACTQAIDLQRMLFDIFSTCPQRLAELIGPLQTHPPALFRLIRLVPFTWLADAMRQTTPHHAATITLLTRFQQTLAQLELANASAAQCTALWFQLVVQHWLQQDWAALAPDRIIVQFLYRLKQQQTVSQTALRQAFAATLEGLPTMLKQALKSYLGATPSGPPPQKASDNKPPLREPEKLVHPLPINNAGLVLLQSFFNPLFSRLKLIHDGQFIDANAQRRAVHYLQFLVSGQQATPEQYLSLNKLLCGLTLHEPIEAGIDMPPAEIELCNSLIQSVIGYWPAIGSSSLDGFRGNWLVRNGTLADANDHWAVSVEKRAYDLLLARSPFSYTVIKLPWMQKAVYVTWPT